MKKKDIFIVLSIAFIFIFLIFNNYFVDLIAYFLNINNNFLQHPFIPKNDYLTQHTMFYEEFFRCLDSGNFGWSWNYLMGADIIGTKSFYMVGDIYAYFGYFIHLFYDCTPAIMFLLIICKFLVAYLLFYKFLTYFINNLSVRMVISLGYALSGFFLVYIEQPMFLSFYSLMPLWLICVEAYFINKKKFAIMLPLATLLIICTNAFIAYSGCWFLLVYWTVRYIQVKDVFVFKDYLKDSFSFLGFFLIGVIFSSGIMIPFLKAMLRSPRLNSVDIIDSLKIKDIYAYIKGLYLPLMFNYNDGLYKGIYYVSQFAMYSGTITFILSQVWLFENYRLNRKKFVTWLIPLVFFVCCLFIPQTWSLFCISQNLRWSYYIAIISLILCAQVLENNFYKNFKLTKWVILVNLLVVLVLGYFYYRYFTIKYSYITIQFVLATCLILMVLFSFVGNYKSARNSTILIMAIEYAIFPTLALSFVYEDDKTINTVLFRDKESILSSFNKLKAFDKTFYRVLLPDNELNYGVYLGIPNARTYDSSYQYSLEKFYVTHNIKTANSWTVDLMAAVNNADFSILQELDVKYIISQEEFDEYDCLTKVDLGTELNIYKLNLDTGLGEIIINNNSVYYSPINIEDNLIKFEFDNLSGKLICKIPYSSNWVAYEDNRKIDTMKSEDGFILINLSNANTLELKYINIDSYYGFVLSGFGLIIWILLLRSNYEKN